MQILCSKGKWYLAALVYNKNFMEWHNPNDEIEVARAHPSLKY